MKRLVLIIMTAVMMSVCFTGCGCVSTGQDQTTKEREKPSKESDKDSPDKGKAKDKGSISSKEKKKGANKDEATLLENDGNVEIVIPEGQEHGGQ